MEKEIILRKNIYTGKSHKLIQTDIENEYEFVPAESWMPYYITYNKDYTKIKAFDSDGFGYPACIGEIVGNYVIKDIFEKDNKIIFKLKEK